MLPKNHDQPIGNKTKILSADDTVCNENQKSSNARTITNQLTQPKTHEKAHFSNALNGSAQKNALGNVP